MSRSAGGGVRWGAVALGWVVAVLAGIVISPLLRLLYGLFAGPTVGRGEFAAAGVIISLLSGFLAYLLGGYIAGRGDSLHLGSLCGGIARRIPGR